MKRPAMVRRLRSHIMVGLFGRAEAVWDGTENNPSFGAAYLTYCRQLSSGRRWEGVAISAPDPSTTLTLADAKSGVEGEADVASPQV